MTQDRAGPGRRRLERSSDGDGSSNSNGSGSSGRSNSKSNSSSNGNSTPMAAQHRDDGDGGKTMAALRADLERDGFVVVRSILGPEQLGALRAASPEAEALARSGRWPHVRTLGKQFPPWEETPEAGIWGVQHLMKPAMPRSAQFAALYFSDALLGIVRGLLQCDDEALVMELLNLLVRPERDFALGWHRDDIAADATAAEEEARLGHPAFHAQYNLALVDGDEALVLVPGSHRRPRTEAKRAAGPQAAALLGQLVVRLAAGDVAFYDNILHRGVYSSGRDRLKLHGSVGHVAGGSLRARNVLQHGVGTWIHDVDLSALSEPARRRAEGMRARLVAMGGGVEDGGRGLGFSHQE